MPETETGEQLVVEATERIPPLVIRMQPDVRMTDDQFFDFCQINRDLRIERTAEGEILVMPPAGFQSGRRNAEITAQLTEWARTDARGVVTDSSGGYTLPNHATRAPDAAWTLASRLASISEEQQEKFLPLCPDFVIELRSRSDRLPDLQAKMEEYSANGARLGWLIEPYQRQVYVYRPGAVVQCLENPETISGDPELPGFVLDLRKVW